MNSSDSDSIQFPAAVAERFEPIERLGTGRTSRLIRATDGQRDVAVKLLHDHLADDEAIRRRLRRELKASRRLDHPAVVRILDLVEDDDAVALIMQFVDGPSVREHVADEGPMSWSDVRPVLVAALEGLEHAHSRGIWHRDLSARQILLSDDPKATITGFGFARIEELAGMTMHTRMLGALEAMAPERITGDRYDARADIYSVAAVAWEMLTGHPPFEGGIAEAFRHARRPLDLDDEMPDDVGPDVRYVLERALATDPNARFATAAQFRRAVEDEFDVGFWQAWTRRGDEVCPDCSAPVIEGLSRCLECGHEFRRLLQDAPNGDYYVKVLSKHDAWEPDVFFEVSTEPRWLTEDQFQALMELLNGYDDTAQFADSRWKYFWTPYLLFVDLVESDARRVAEKLDDVGIDCEIGRYVDMRSWWDQWGRRREDERQLPPLSMSHIETCMVIMVLALLAWSFLAPGVGSMIIAVGLGLLSYLVVFRRFERLPAVETDEEISSTHAGYTVMIPPERLDETKHTDRSVLPDRIDAALESVDDDQIRRQLHEFAALGIGIARTRPEATSAIRTLLDHLLDVAERLAETLHSVSETPAVDLVDELQSVETKLAQETSDQNRGELTARRDKLLDALDRRDDTEHRADELQSSLLRARGMLLDLRGRRQMMFEPAEVDDAVDEVRVVLEASEEARSLAAAVEEVQ